MHSINVSFAQLSVLTNDEGTRSFVTAEIGAGYNEVKLHTIHYKQKRLGE